MLLVALVAAPAWAIPPFARKYGTACQTCHTVFPKLNRFGEAFRRNGFRFPGVDSDAVKVEAIPLGHEGRGNAFPGAVWPGSLPSIPPVGVSVDGAVRGHPDLGSTSARADGQAPVDLRDALAELHLWAGGSFDDRATFFAQLTATSAGEVSVENAELHFSDLLGAQAGQVQLVVGRAQATLTSFGPHSSYLADAALTSAPLRTLLGGTGEGFRLLDSRTGVELNGLLARQVTWAVGVAAGPSVDVHPAEVAWAHAGFVWGGDEGEASASERWSHPLLAADVFATHARERFGAAELGFGEDVTSLAGGAVRVQLGALELDSSVSFEAHDAAQPSGGAATLWVHADELSWVALPWLVPAVRFEYLRAAPEGAAPMWSARLVPGVALLVRQNVKVGFVARFEAAHGAPLGGWSRSGGEVVPPSADARVAFEWESLSLTAGAAF